MVWAVHKWWEAGGKAGAEEEGGKHVANGNMAASHNRLLWRASKLHTPNCERCTSNSSLFPNAFIAQLGERTRVEVGGEQADSRRESGQDRGAAHLP